MRFFYFFAGLLSAVAFVGLADNRAVLASGVSDEPVVERVLVVDCDAVNQVPDSLKNNERVAPALFRLKLHCEASDNAMVLMNIWAVDPTEGEMLDE